MIENDWEDHTPKKSEEYWCAVAFMAITTILLMAMLFVGWLTKCAYASTVEPSPTVVGYKPAVQGVVVTVDERSEAPAFDGVAVCLAAIAQIESSSGHDKRAYNIKRECMGKYQVGVHSALADYNLSHKSRYTALDMLEDDKNEIVARWYLFVRLPVLLANYQMPITEENVVKAYNIGARALKRGNIRDLGAANRYYGKYLEAKRVIMDINGAIMTRNSH